MTERERQRLFYLHMDHLYDTSVKEYERQLQEKMGTPLNTEQEKSDKCEDPWESFEAAEKLLNIDVHSLQPSERTKYLRTERTSNQGHDLSVGFQEEAVEAVCRKNAKTTWNSFIA